MAYFGTTPAVSTSDSGKTDFPANGVISTTRATLVGSSEKSTATGLPKELEFSGNSSIPTQAKKQIFNQQDNAIPKKTSFHGTTTNSAGILRMNSNKTNSTKKSGFTEGSSKTGKCMEKAKYGGRLKNGT